MESIFEKRPWLKNYPKDVPHDLEIPSCSALDDFKASASRKPNAPAVYYFDYTISYEAIDRASDSLAFAFTEFNITKGDRILLILQNIPQFIVVTYAAWKIGAIVVPVNPMYKEKELDYLMRDSGAKIVVTLNEIAAGIDFSFTKETPVQKILTTSATSMLPVDAELPAVLRNLKKPDPNMTVDMDELIRDYDGRKVDYAKVSPDDVAYLTYTSGTTGPPKGAMNTHGNIAFNARVYQAMQCIDDKDVVLGVAPLFHVTGEVAHLALAALAGIPVVLYYRFDPAETLRLIERWKVTTTVASITVFISLMNHPDIKKRDLSSMRKAYSGGAPVSEATVNQFNELTGLYIHNVYGMTETNSPSHIVPLGQKAPVDPQSGALSVGIPVPNCVTKIVDVDNGIDEIPPGEAGEIVDFGPNITPGYWQKPEETRHAIRNGWLYTGDVGVMDENGWFYVVDRKKDMIVASGYKVWPRDVEDVIFQHPAVKETSVVGVKDPYRGETVKAFVALKAGMEGKVTPEEIIDFCKSRMAAYKYPRQVEFIPEIPKTLTGKFLRRSLRDKDASEKKQGERHETK